MLFPLSHSLVACSCISHTVHNTTLLFLRRRHKPTTAMAANPTSLKREFKSLCIGLAKTHHFRITDEAMRHLRLTMVQTVETRDHLPEALLVVFAALAERTKRGIELDDVREWLSPRPTDTERSADDDDESNSEDDPKGELTRAVRRALDRVDVDGKTYFLVDWEPTLEPCANLPQTLVVAFNRERRALVRRTYIEDEAVEDNSLNITEQ